MTGGEIIAAAETAEVIGKKLLAEDDETKNVLLRLAEDTPQMKAAAQSMAARAAVKERVKLKLYQPFARMVGVSKTYFDDTFPQEMAAKVANIPDENLTTPAASIAVPTLQGLSYTFEEPDLKEMFLNLLTTASDDRRTGEAHPAFAEIIKQLDANETKLLNLVLSAGRVAAARVKDQRSSPPGSYVVLRSHLLPLEDDEGEPEEEPQLATWVDNWQRLGLVSVSYTEYESGDGMYDWVKVRPEYTRMAERTGIDKLSFDRGLVVTTDFGKRFFRAVTE